MATPKTCWCGLTPKVCCFSSSCGRSSRAEPREHLLSAVIPGPWLLHQGLQARLSSHFSDQFRSGRLLSKRLASAGAFPGLHITIAQSHVLSWVGCTRSAFQTVDTLAACWRLLGAPFQWGKGKEGMSETQRCVRQGFGGKPLASTHKCTLWSSGTLTGRQTDGGRTWSTFFSLCLPVFPYILIQASRVFCKIKKLPMHISLFKTSISPKLILYTLRLL